MNLIPPLITGAAVCFWAACLLQWKIERDATAEPGDLGLRSPAAPGRNRKRGHGLGWWLRQQRVLF